MNNPEVYVVERSDENDEDDDDEEEEEVERRVLKNWKEVRLNTRHVEAISRGEFLYDLPLVERLTELGSRLSTLDHYVSLNAKNEREIRGPRAAMLMSDLQDYLEVLSQLHERANVLHYDHEMLNRVVFDQSLTKNHAAWVLKKFRIALYKLARMIGIFPELFRPDRDSQRRRIDAADLAKVPTPFLSFEEQLDQVCGRTASLLFAATNQSLHWWFVCGVLYSVSENIALFALGLCFIVLSFASRLGLCLSFWYDVEWTMPSTVYRFWGGTLCALVDPRLGIKIIAKGAVYHERSLQVSDIRTSQIPLQKDVVAAGASASYRTVYSLFYMGLLQLLEDVPMLVIQGIYLQSYGKEYGYSHAVATAQGITATFVIVQLFYMWSHVRRVRSLRLLLNARNLVIEHALPPEDDGLTEEQMDTDDEDEEAVAMDLANKRTGKRAAKRMARLQKLKRRREKRKKKMHDSLSAFTVKQVMRRYADPPVRPYVDFSLLPSIWWQRLDIYTVRKFYKVHGMSPAGVGASDAVHSSRCLLFNLLEREAPYNALRTLQVTHSSEVNANIIRSIITTSPTLQHLNVSYCEHVDDEAMAVLQETEATLVSIYVDGCIQITDEGIRALSLGCKSTLVRLSMRNVLYVTDLGIACLAMRCFELRELYLDRDPFIIQALLQKEGILPTAKWDTDSYLDDQFHSSGRLFEVISQKVLSRLHKAVAKKDSPIGKIGDQGLIALGVSCPKLTTLMIDYATGMTAEGLSRFCYLVTPFLQHLGLSGHQEVTDERLREIVTRLPHLKTLRLSRTSITDQSVPLIIGLRQSLRALSLEGTSVSVAGIADIQKSVPAYDFAHVSLNSRAEHLIQRYKKLCACFLRVAEVTQNTEIQEVIESKILQEIESCNEQLSKIAKGDIYASWSSFIPSSWPGHSKGREHNLETIVAQGIRHLAFAVDFIRRMLWRHAPSPLGYTAKEQSAWHTTYSSQDLEALQDECAEYQRLIVDGNVSSVATEAGQDNNADDSMVDTFPFASLPPMGLELVLGPSLKFNLALCTYTFMVPLALRDMVIDQETSTLCGRISPKGPMSMEMRKLCSRGELARASQFVYVHPLLDRRRAAWFRENKVMPTGLVRLVTWGGFAFLDHDGDFVGAAAHSLGATIGFNGPFPVEKKVLGHLQLAKRFRKYNGDLRYAFLHGNEGGSPHNTCGAFVFRARPLSENLEKACPVMYTIAPEWTPEPEQWALNHSHLFHKHKLEGDTLAISIEDSGEHHDLKT